MLFRRCCDDVYALRHHSMTHFWPTTTHYPIILQMLKVSPYNIIGRQQHEMSWCVTVRMPSRTKQHEVRHNKLSLCNCNGSTKQHDTTATVSRVQLSTIRQQRKLTFAVTQNKQYFWQHNTTMFYVLHKKKSTDI